MSLTENKLQEDSLVTVHRAPLRVMHLLNAIAIFILIPSGWQIFNAAPLYPIVFPQWATLGTSLTGALLWHFAAMWLLIFNGLAYIIYRIILRRGGAKLLPISPKALLKDILSVFQFRLGHDLGRYNAIQQAMYVGVWLIIALVVLSGLVMWKPVQFQSLTYLMGGYEMARRVHFWCMTGICAFVIVHLVMALGVPRTLLTIAFGVTTQRKAIGEET